VQESVFDQAHVADFGSAFEIGLSAATAETRFGEALKVLIREDRCELKKRENDAKGARESVFT